MRGAAVDRRGGDTVAVPGNGPLSCVAARRHGDRDAAGGDTGLLHHAPRAGRSRGGDARRTGDGRRHRAVACVLRARQAAARAVRLLAGRACARQSRPVDLPAAAGDAGARRARGADVLPHAVRDGHCDTDRRTLRHRRRRLAEQLGRPGVLGIRDAGRQHPELLAGIDPDADVRGGPRLVPGGRLRRSGRAAVQSPPSSGAAGDRARRGELGADPALQPGEHAGRARARITSARRAPRACRSGAWCCTTRCATR